MTRRTRTGLGLAVAALAAIALGRPHPVMVAVDSGPVGQRVVVRAVVVIDDADASRTGLLAEVDAIDAGRLAVDRPVVVARPGGGEPIAHGRVAKVADRAVRIAWTDAAPALPPGAAVEAITELDPHHAEARIPRTAVSVRDGRTVVERPALAALWRRETEVEVVAADGSYAAVKGLAPGDVVIVPDGPSR